MPRLRGLPSHRLGPARTPGFPAGAVGDAHPGTHHPTQNRYRRRSEITRPTLCLHHPSGAHPHTPGTAVTKTPITPIPQPSRKEGYVSMKTHKPLGQVSDPGRQIPSFNSGNGGARSCLSNIYNIAKRGGRYSLSRGQCTCHRSPEIIARPAGVGLFRPRERQ